MISGPRRAGDPSSHILRLCSYTCNPTGTGYLGRGYLIHGRIIKLSKFDRCWVFRQGQKKRSVCAQSCLTPCNLMDCSSLGSSVHGIVQARVPEWVAMSYSK